MAKRYPPEVSEAIWALLCEDIGAREIQRRLAAGDAGLPEPVEMPRRTLNDRIAALKRRRGLPSPTVTAGAEIDAAQAITRRLLEAIGRTEARLTAASKSRPLTGPELTACDRAAKITQDIERRHRDIHAEPAPPSPQKRASDAGRDVPRSDFLTELERRQRAEQDDDPPAASVTSST